jgi:ribonuclease BN (tRNA processing enzyme)
MTVIAQRPLEVLPLGVGDAFSSTDYYTSMIVFGGRTLCQVDCPDPIHKVLAERASCFMQEPITARHIDHVLLTHIHGDHCGGLESLLFYRKFVLDAPPLTIHTIAEIAEVLWSEKLAISMARTYMPENGIDQTFTAEDYFRVRVVRPGTPFVIGDLRFEIRRTVHPVPTFGFVVRLDDAPPPPAPVRMFGYSCDTVFDRNHVAFLSKADLIFHECGHKGIHTGYDELLTLDPEVRKKIHILHLSDDFDRAHSGFPLVKPGELYRV